jgi:hypothetical protein
MYLRPADLKVGEIYYMVQLRAKSPIVSSYEYKGTVDGKPHLHFFQAVGLSDANVFLENASLKQMLDIAGLRAAIEARHAT